jgi:hypothetical protein
MTQKIILRCLYFNLQNNMCAEPVVRSRWVP